MSSFDSFVVVDWSSGNDTGPTPRKDAIWAGAVIDGVENEPVYLRNRQLAFDWLVDQIQSERDAGRRLMIGFDFPFGYPQGFAKQVTESDDPFTLWGYFADHLEDTPEANNRFALAGALNAKFPGIGPFWFNAGKTDIDHLPRKGTERADHGMPERRSVEELAKGSFTCWQMGGAGAVGGQVMTGLATLERLRRRLHPQIAVWPFEKLDTPVAFVEIWPSLISGVVADANDDIKDRAQVRLLARALSRLSSSALGGMLDVDAPEEGWILGVGHEDALSSAARSRLPNDCFALPVGVDWLPVDEALARLRAAMHSVTDVETTPIMEAGGRVLGTDHFAKRANPPTANSAVDGYGLFLEEPSHGVTRDIVTGRAAPGQPFIGRIGARQAVKVLTGAILPDGVNTVVLDEDALVDGGKLRTDARLKPGANTRRAGEDLGVGDLALGAGHQLRPADLATLAAVGHSTVQVRKRLRVAVLSTGTELRAPGTAAEDHETNDANRPLLLECLRRWGHEPVDLGIVEDDPKAVQAALDRAATEADALLTSGGASASEEDHISSILNANGQLTAWRIALKPGRPLALATWNGCPVFGLPGNPVAAMVCTLIFARPALSKLAGGQWVEPLRVSIPAGFTKSKKAGRREYPRARIGFDGRVELYQSEGSGRISGLSWADGLVELPDGAAEIAPGDPVTYMPFSGFGI